MKKILFGILALLLLPTAAAAATCPAPAFYYGWVPTVAQWQQQFDCKQAVLGYTPVNKAGDTMTGRLVLPNSPTGVVSGFNLTPGISPSAPANGDLWMTAAGLFTHVNGMTVGPTNASLASASSAPSTTLGSLWSNTAGSTYPVSIYDGAQWVTMGTLNPSTHVWTPNGTVINTIVGTANQITASTVSGTTTLSLPSTLIAPGTFQVTGATTLSSALTYGGVTLSNAVTGTGPMVLGTSAALATPAISGGTAVGLTSLGVRNAGTGAFDLTIAHNGTLTAGRALTFNVNDAARTVSLTGNLTLAGSLTTSGAFGTTLTATGTTALTLPTSGTLYGTATGSITSAQMLASMSDETGTGALVFGTAPAISSPTFSGSATGVSASLLDTLGSTQGQILYRNASAWVPLSPGTTGQYLTSGGAAANVSWTSPPTVGRNLLINGGLWLDQRNAGAAQTLSIGAARYTVDRFYALTAGASPSGQRVAGTAPYQYAYKITGTVGNTTTAWGQRVLSTNACPSASQTMAFQAQIAASALVSVTWTAYYANSTDNWSGHTQIATGTFTITSTPTVYTTTFNAGANACNGIEIVLSTGALTSGTIQYAGLQLETAAAANGFENVDYKLNLDKCLYYAAVTRANGVLQNIGWGYMPVSGRLEIAWNVGAVMRTTPTITFTGSAADLLAQFNNTSATITSYSGADARGAINSVVQLEVNFSGGTQGQGGQLNWQVAAPTTSNILADAEL